MCVYVYKTVHMSPRHTSKFMQKTLEIVNHWSVPMQGSVTWPYRAPYQLVLELVHNQQS